MLFSVDRFNLLSLRQSDYGPNFRNKDSHVQLATYAREMAAKICPDHVIDKVLLLTFPRILGVAFNPVSIYLLRDGKGRDLMYIYEVRNTFGDMHSYVGRAGAAAAAGEGSPDHNAGTAPAPASSSLVAEPAWTGADLVGELAADSARAL